MLISSVFIVFTSCLLGVTIADGNQCAADDSQCDSRGPIIVVGGGLSGCSAAHTILEQGRSVVVIDKNPFLGGNSVKATSGINGAGTDVQKKRGLGDTREIFEEDTIRSATGVKTGPCPPSYPLGKVLAFNSKSAVEWLNGKFELGLDTVGQLGGHSFPRTHRRGAGGKFPGMMITYALMQALERISEAEPTKARVITRARVNKLLTDDNGAVVGVEYIKGGQTYQEHGPVVVTTGGYGAGVLFDNSLLKKIRPELGGLPTTNGEHCTGDGIEFSVAAGAGAVDLKHVQVHPTGLVAHKDPDNRVKFLAAGALRGEGGLLLNKDGKRFVNELGTRDYVTGKMWQNKPPFRLVLNGRAKSNIAWHCKHYVGRGVMKQFANGYELAKEMGVSPAVLKATFDEYNEAARKNKDKYDLKFFKAAPVSMDDDFHVGVVTPVVHYTMGGLEINDQAEVLNGRTKQPLPGLFAAGEVAGGVHGRNRLGGSALLECVVFGRVAGETAAKYVGSTAAPQQYAVSGGGDIVVKVERPDGTKVTITIGAGGEISTGAPSRKSQVPAAIPLEELLNTDSDHGGGISTGAPPDWEGGSSAMKEYTMEEVAKHNTDKDAWVVVNGQVLDVTSFLKDHPGGKLAIMTFVGGDATVEFNMLHEKEVIGKYAPEVIIGTLKK